jgi:hypothetical protein
MVENLGFGWRKENDVSSPMIMLKPNWPYETISLSEELGKTPFIVGHPPHGITVHPTHKGSMKRRFRIGSGFIVEENNRGQYYYWDLSDRLQWTLTQNSLEVYCYSERLQLWVCQDIIRHKDSGIRKTFGKKIPITKFYCSRNPDPSIEDTWRTNGNQTWFDKTTSSGRPLRRTGNRWDCYQQGFNIYKKKQKSLNSQQKRLLQYYEDHPENIPASAR